MRNEELAERFTLVKLDVPFKTKEDAMAAIYALPNLTSFVYRAQIDKELFRSIRSLKKLEHLQIRSVQPGVKKLNWRSLKPLKSLYISVSILYYLI